MDDDAPLTFTLQNIRKQAYGGASKFVNLTCPLYYIGPVRVACPGTNSTVATNCTGRYPVIDPVTGLLDHYDYEMTTKMSCSTAAEPSCLMWNPALQIMDPNMCRVQNYTSTNTTCVCGSQAEEASAEGGAARARTRAAAGLPMAAKA